MKPPHASNNKYTKLIKIIVRNFKYPISPNVSRSNEKIRKNNITITSEACELKGVHIYSKGPEDNLTPNFQEALV
jgi:hypothetical protein